MPFHRSRACRLSTTSIQIEIGNCVDTMDPENRPVTLVLFRGCLGEVGPHDQAFHLTTWDLYMEGLSPGDGGRPFMGGPRHHNQYSFYILNVYAFKSARSTIIAV